MENHEESEATKFNFKVENISNLDKFKSRDRSLHDQKWNIETEKIVRDDGGYDLALHLDLHVQENNKQAFVAGAKIQLKSSNGAESTLNTSIGPEFFDSKKSRSSTTIDWDIITAAEKGYITNDACSFEISIWAYPVDKNVGIDEIRNPSDGSRVEFEMQVDDIRENLFAYSDFITVKNVPWRVIIALKDGQMKRLTVRLQCLYKSDAEWSIRAKFSCQILALGEVKNQPAQLDDFFSQKKQQRTLFVISENQLFDPKNLNVPENANYFYMKVQIKVNEMVGIEKKGTKRKASDGAPSCVPQVVGCGKCTKNLNGIQAKMTKCGHIFCAVCIDNELEQVKRCPACNKKALPKQLREAHLSYYN